jgi:hypothetical protein
MEIPPELLPAANQYPPGLDEAQRKRWALCFAITRKFCGRDDPLFTCQLFDSDIPDPENEPASESGDASITSPPSA